MKTAIIDLGTNSVRFDVYQFGPRDQIRLLHREKLMVRLGQGVFIQGVLDKSAIKRTLSALAHFKRVASHLGAARIVAFGTSALREARDRESFKNLVHEKCGID